MRIDPEDQLFGYPILTIRDLLRKRVFNHTQTREFLKVDAAEAERVMQALADKWYICKVQHPGALRPDLWETTPDGSQLAMASTLPPITRAEADVILEDLKERILHIRDSDDFLYHVQQALVFGSYIRGAEALSDVDVIVKLRPKSQFGGSFDDILRAKLDALRAQGISIAAPTDWVRAMQVEIFNYLRKGSQYLGLLPENQLKVIEEADRRRGLPNPGLEYRVIYDFEVPQDG